MSKVQCPNCRGKKVIKDKKDSTTIYPCVYCDVNGTVDENWGTKPPEQFQNPPNIYNRPIQEHGGGKYLRKIYPADGKGEPINIDIYCVIEAFAIHCPALQHALKKIVACGQRGKGSKIDDIHGVFDAMWRALELQYQREQENSNG